MPGIYEIAMGGERAKGELPGWRESLSAVTGVYSSVGSVPAPDWKRGEQWRLGSVGGVAGLREARVERMRLRAAATASEMAIDIGSRSERFRIAERDCEGHDRGEDREESPGELEKGELGGKAPDGEEPSG